MLFTSQNLIFFKQTQHLPSEKLAQFNLIIGIFTIEPKLSEFYPDCLNAFCLCLTCEDGDNTAGVTSSFEFFENKNFNFNLVTF